MYEKSPMNPDDAINPTISNLHVGLLVVFLFFSFSTTARFLAGIVGPSEIAIGVMMLTSLFSWQNLSWHRGAIYLWVAFLLTLAIAWALNAKNNPLASHNMIAYIYNCITSMFVLAYLISKNDRAIYCFIRVYVVITMGLFTMAALAFLSNDLSIMQALRMNLVIPQRLSFWASNPNQLSLAMLPLPLMIVWLHKSDSFTWQRASLLFLTLAICFFIGLIMHSDALFFAWVAAITVMFMMLGLRRSNLAGWKVVIIAFALASAFMSYKTYTSQPKPVAASASVEQAHSDSAAKTPSDSPFGVGMGENKVSIRGELWSHAFDAWMQSPLIGHGPGAFSWIGESSAIAEAHNMIIDIATQSGIVGTVICLAVFWVLVLRSWRARNSFALALLAGVIMFSMAHFVMRLPIFWFYLLFCYLLTRPPTNTHTTSAPIK